MKLNKALFILPLAALLGGCVTVPDFEPTKEQSELIPESWLAQNVQSEDAVDLGLWWESWNDPVLTGLIKASQSANTDIKKAQATLRMSEASVLGAYSGLLPTVEGSADKSRSYIEHLGSNNYGIGLNGSWTIDAGGSYAALQAAEAAILSDEASLGDVQVNIAAQVAYAYVGLRLSQRQLEVARQNLVTQEESLHIADWRYRAGLVDSTDVDQARTSYEQTRAIIPGHEANVQMYRNQLAQLTGVIPEKIPVTGPFLIPEVPENIALSIPADVMRRRPSVRKAEADVMAALADHAVAKSAFFPSLRIGGTVGLQSDRINSLGDEGTHYKSFFGSITLPIFKGGSLIAQYKKTDAQVAAANANYEASLLAAVSEVENALNKVLSGKRKLIALETAVGSARSAATNARQNYEAGLEDFTVVLTTQRSLLTVEESYAKVQAEIADGYIDLYKALGGGWKVPEEFEK